MLSLLTLLLALVWPLHGIAGAQTLSYSRFDFGNGYRLDREDAFPNARSSTGNTSGDFLYKAFPKEVFARPGKIRVSGVRITFTLDKSYQGNFPAFVTVPEIAFFPLVGAKIEGATYDVPDLARRAARSIPQFATSVFKGGLQLYEVRLGPQQPDPRLRAPIELDAFDASNALQGWAVAIMAPPGEKIGDGLAHFVCVPTFREIHRQGAPPSFSGMYDARAQALRPYGTTAAPSNVGELAIELLLDQPTLQVFSDASGGVRNDPKRIETHKGPGAYVNHLATSIVPGYFGLFCQHEIAGATEDLWCMPVVTAVGPAMPSSLLGFGRSTLIWDSARSSAATVFLGTGNVGRLTIYKAGGHAGHSADQRGVYATVRIPVPQDPNLSGLTMWIQCVIARPRDEMFVGETNLVRVVY